MRNTPIARVALFIHGLPDADIKRALNLTYWYGSVSLYKYTLRVSGHSALREGILDLYREVPTAVVDNSTFDPWCRLPEPSRRHAFIDRNEVAVGACGFCDFKGDDLQSLMRHLGEQPGVAGFVYRGIAALRKAQRNDPQATNRGIIRAANALLYAKHGRLWPPLLTVHHHNFMQYWVERI
jgi:hypothetical protein